MKNPVTPAGIEPAIFRFVAQHFNHCAAAVTHIEQGNESRSVFSLHLSLPLFPPLFLVILFFYICLYVPM